MALFEAMVADNSDFCWNFGTVLNHWKSGGLRVAALTETDAMYERRVDDVFLRAGHYLLPAFVSAEAPAGPIKLLWVCSQLRRRGLGTALVRQGSFAPPAQKDVLPVAASFWNAAVPRGGYG